MFRIRKYHTKNRFLRLLDYAALPEFPAKLSRPVDSDFLLRSRAKLRYGRSDLRLEEATALAAYFDAFKDLHVPDLQQALERRLPDLDLNQEEEAWRRNSLGPVMTRLLQNTAVAKSDLEAYTNCFLAPSFTEAMSAMGERTWPSFLVLYSLNREFYSRTEAYQVIKLYLRHIEQAPPDFQMEMTSLAIRVAQNHIVEMTPPICEIFVAYGCAEAKSPFALNELLWILAKFGTHWTKSESLVLVAAQEVLVRAIGRKHLDMKGRAGLALTVLPSSRETALNLVNFAGEDIPEFAYRTGRQVVEILASETAEGILEKLSGIEPKYRTSRVWSVVLSSLRKHGMLDARLAERIWYVLNKEGVKLSHQLCELILQVPSATRERIKKLSSMKRAGLDINDRMLASFFNVSSRDELQVAAQYIASYGEIAGSTVVLAARMAAEAKFQKNAVWGTYKEILSRGPPTVDVLESLCIAAWAPVIWDGLHGVQRAIPEVKAWVRHKAEDVLNLYPSQRLVYSYIFMLGKAQYDEELLDVLPWLEELNFAPEKRVLCALIHHSSHGQALLKLGAKAEGEWPTPGELELYAHGLAKSTKSV